MCTPVAFFIYLDYIGQRVPMTPQTKRACGVDKHGRIPGPSMGIVAVGAELFGIGLGRADKSRVFPAFCADNGPVVYKSQSQVIPRLKRPSLAHNRKRMPA